MGYNYVVCIKYVPDTKRVTGDAMTEDGTVNRAALPMIFNPEDLHSLEEALTLRDEHGGNISVITMGPPSACEILRQSLYRGADRAIILTDRRAAASDTLATSYILSCAIRNLSPDIVFCGRQAIDGDTAQVGPQMAQKLGFPVITYAEEILRLEGRKIKVRRNVGNGWEVVSTSLPAVITVTETANTPRPPAARRIMKYKEARSPAEVTSQLKEQMPQADGNHIEAEARKRCEQLRQKSLLIDQWSMEDIQADLAWCGRSGSPTKVHKIQSVVLAGGEYHEIPPTEEGISELVHELLDEHIVG